MEDAGDAGDVDDVALETMPLDAPMSTPALGRTASRPDMLISEEDVARQFLRWKEDLAEVTAQPGEVLEELLIANVRDYGWDTGEHLSQVLISSNESEEASAACRRVFARARLAPSDPLATGMAVDGAEEGSGGAGGDPCCVVCRESGGDLVTVSAVCGHRLHRVCLAEGLCVQLREGARSAASLRCPACPEQRAAPVPPCIAAAVLAGRPAISEALEREKWLEAGQGSLFRTCPSGACRIRPSRANYSMQVACKCAEAHRFCCYCGREPHEPVPCAQMMELQGFLESARRELDELRAQPLDNMGSQEADRAALLLDVQQALAEAPAAAAGGAATSAIAPSSTICPPCADGAPPLESLHEEYQLLLGGRPRGTLRSSAEAALVLLRGWRLWPALDAGAAPPAAAEVVPEAKANGSERVLNATTRPCPRCFIAIEREGGCQHMTCTNPRCRHEFCWLCLREWRSPAHDGLRCALQRLEVLDVAGAAAGSSATESVGAARDQVLASVEARIRENWEAQPEETRPARQEDYAEEVRRRFDVALTTVMNSDRELLMPTLPEDEPHPLHLSLRLMQLYEQRERQARAAAASAFSERGAAVADPVARAQALTEVRGFVQWIQARWWLRLAPEDAAEPALLADAVADGGGGAGEFADRELTRFVRIRAEHAVHCLRRREASRAQARMRAALGDRFLARFARRGPEAGPLPEAAQQEALRLFGTLVEDWRRDSDPHGQLAELVPGEHDQKAKAPAQPGTTAGPGGPDDSPRRALALAAAATRAWRAGRLLELVGALEPMQGQEARRAAVAVDRWVDEVEERAAALRTALVRRRKAPNSAAHKALRENQAPDGAGHTPTQEKQAPSDAASKLAREQQVAQATKLLDAARRSVFQFALEYCGGTRRTVRRRGER